MNHIIAKAAIFAACVVIIRMIFHGWRIHLTRDEFGDWDWWIDRD